jgi:hypothetical protein
MRGCTSLISVSCTSLLARISADDVGTQEWTKVPVQSGPAGRYGHAVTMHDSKFYIFGGQAEGAFMDDLWAYDIRQCRYSALDLADDSISWWHPYLGTHPG